ncbi:hypothetical protein, partial [Pseudophaeobacter arcticus]|uniref:hypothetical protein n=1 Tax=Pseudophaeobacter arcticus TaxID=385492 RepID=UPI0024911E75
MTDRSRLNLLHVGLAADAASWASVASSLITVDALDGFHFSVDKERLEQPAMTGTGLRVASVAGKKMSSVPNLRLPLRGCKSGGAGDGVSAGAGANNELLDILLEHALGTPVVASTGDTTDGSDAGTGTTVTMDAASALVAGRGIVVKGADSGKLSAREVVSVSTADVTVDRGLTDKGTAEDADEGEVAYGMDTYTVDWDLTNHKHLTAKLTKDSGLVETLLGLHCGGWELDFPSGAFATLALTGMDFSDHNQTEGAGTRSEPTV